MRNILSITGYLLVAGALLAGLFTMSTSAVADAAVPAGAPVLMTVTGTVGQGGNVADSPLAGLSGLTGQGGNA